ncbi:MAG: MurT ligase domain-containing protein [Amnibacterium sp.]
MPPVPIDRLGEPRVATAPRALRHRLVDPPTVLIGRSVRGLTRLRGGGTALPGLVVERVNPRFLGHVLAQLPLGVAVVSGTNGKTTTTKLAVELLRRQGVKVFTNPSGSNFSRGVVSALLNQVDAWGHLDADIAVLELDEAHGVRFVEQVAPRFCLLLNVFRDQLDRFGEIDATARLLRSMAARTTDALVLNRDDPRVASIAATVPDTPVRYFGLGPALQGRFPGDDRLHGGGGGPLDAPPADVLLSDMDGAEATFEFDGTDHRLALRLRGDYNLVNAAAALTLVRAVLGDAVQEDALLGALATVPPAFGRGESIDVDGTTVELVLVKNPAGFRLALGSFDPAAAVTAIAINDHDNDSRDVSWLWDVDFSPLRDRGVAMVTGTRAADMALRLRYDEIRPDRVVPSPAAALDELLATSAGRTVRIFCTYTAMLQLRRRLAALVPLPGIDR